MIETPANAASDSVAGSGTDAKSGAGSPFAAANASSAAMSAGVTDAPLSPCPKFAASALKSEPFTELP